ncbi:MAG: hypothetical protein Tp1122DCM00d2C27307611_6 [Prokaryotic dsDNA virus sp.]|nr:MAG: hypothetical protein Tp1122DCM00d2C27307611_6 [Prokaryotic dsDNA virus sp.]|tara:strand:- start:9139 stop:10206 length:1068 start_codon:yes stop_codon:yes gene_type:complete
MSQSYYQLATQPRLYVSYPLFQYAVGALDQYAADGEVLSDEQLIQLIQLDPSKTISVPETDSTAIQLNYRVSPLSDTTDMRVNKLWDFNYYMVLGHNFASANVYSTPYIMRQNYQDAQVINSNYIKNSIVGQSPPAYDGFSISQLSSNPVAFSNHNIFRLQLSVENLDASLKIGSLAWGSYFDFPHNANINESLTVDYGIKKKETISGKTISTMNWNKTNNWINEPFGLSSPNVEIANNFSRRTGRRTWSISFDSLAPENVMPQYPFTNTRGFQAKSNHTTDSFGNSEYTINNGIDFYTKVVHRTLGGHLPMVLQLDKDVESSEGFAIVRMDKDYKIVQKTPNLYNIRLKLIEQI